MRTTLRRCVICVIIVMGLAVAPHAQTKTRNTGTQTPEPDGLLVVHVTQNAKTGLWTERATYRICASTVTKKGPQGETIEYVAVAVSKGCGK